MSETMVRQMERAAYRLLVKFHNETECGANGVHWAECEALHGAFGWPSWEAWTNFESSNDFVARELRGVLIEQKHWPPLPPDLDL